MGENTFTSRSRTTRRVVLSGLAGGLGVAFVGPARQATAAGALVTVSPLADRTSVATSKRSVVQVPSLLGAELKVSGKAVRAGSSVAVEFDGRLYRVNPPILTTATGQPIPCRLTRTPFDSASGPATATVTLDQDLPPGETYKLSLGSRRLVRYPHDILASPKPIQITVTDQSTDPSKRELPASPETEHPVWGLQVGVGWQAVYWGDGFHSWVPQLVTVASTGPTDVPANTIVSATLDARLFRGARFKPLSGNGAAGRDGREADGVLRLSWALRSPLAAGRRVSVQLLTDVVTPAGPLAGLHPPTVTARAADAAVGQRTTGRESTSREDSAHDLVTRLTYGLDLITPLKPR